MFINYLKTALRSLRKNKSTSIINVLGLSIGISSALIIFFIIQHENNYDKWEPYRDRIYRIYTQFGTIGTNPGVSAVAPKEINNKVTGIDVLAHFYYDVLDKASLEIPQSSKKIKTVNLNEKDKIAFADEAYFKIFPYQFLVGNTHSLNNLNNAVISESSARQFFPNILLNNVIGKQLIFNDSIRTTITGVFSDLRQRSDFKYKIFISLKTLTETSLIDGYVGTPMWSNVNSGSQCFVRLHDATNRQNVERQLRQLYNINIKKDNEKDPEVFARLQPLIDVHLNTQLDGDGAKKNLRNIALLAVVLILLASINFINLTTAQSSLRAKEIGVRKTFGGNKQQIVFQFLSETFLVIVASTILALAWYPVLFHFFKVFIPEEMPISVIFQPITFIYLILLMVLLTLLAGVYPAFIMSRYQSIQVLKGKIIHAGKSEKVWLRQSLIVFQFAVAQVFLIVVFVVGKQIHYVLNKDMGFKKEAIVSFYTPVWNNGKYGKINVMFQEMEKISGIKKVSIASLTPARNGWHSTRLTYSDKGVDKQFDQVHRRTIDENYLDLFGLHLVAGSNIKVDTSARIPDILINETLMKQVGFPSPQAAIGQYMRGGEADSSRIVGVVRDFNTMSLMNTIYPTVLFANDRGYANMISFSFSSHNTSDWSKTIRQVENIYHKTYIGKTFDYEFYDKTIESLYDSQIRLDTLLKWATGLSMFISCMGLIGLVTFMANQRTKEIGIRKVLGASISQILVILSRSLIGLILIASLISFPIAWYYSHNWLADFAYKTTLSWWIFPICGLGMLLISLTILCSWSFKAAKTNPATVLRTE